MSSENVKVYLPIQRMYRLNHEDRHAITVGPGEVEVPAWVAEEWAKPHPDQQVQPVNNQEWLSGAVEAIVKRITDTLDPTALKEENERLLAEVNRLQDIVDQMTADIADTKAKETLANALPSLKADNAKRFDEIQAEIDASPLKPKGKK